MRALPIISLIPTSKRPRLAPRVVRHPLPGGGLPLSSAVEVPPGVTLVHLAADAPGGPGGTQAQARAVLHAIAERLARLDLGLADLVRLRVSLVADPAHGGRADTEGFAAAWREAFGNGPRPDPPVISVVQVLGLGAPGSLVGIEATAARPAAPTLGSA